MHAGAIDDFNGTAPQATPLTAAQVEARPRGSWVVVDEVQRLPSLLNEVHALIAETGRKYRLALSGSSARKLKRLDVNLLAGRARDPL